MSEEKKRRWHEPEQVFAEYEAGKQYKDNLSDRGMYEQHRINERFYVGDQWYGVQCGDQKPLVRYNVIKRIGDYKMAMASGKQLSVRFSAEGVPCTKTMAELVRKHKDAYRAGAPEEVKAEGDEQINLIMSVLSDYFTVTAERVKFDNQKALALRKAYTAGSGVVYTYWDSTIKTGQFADNAKTSPIKGDIRCEVLDIENVYFGDTAEAEVQNQPYIIIAQRRRVEDLKREARRNNRPTAEVEKIQEDKETEFLAGDINTKEPTGEQKTTVLTKFYKSYDEDGNQHIKAVQVVKGAVVRKEWDTGLSRYPLAKMDWEILPNCAYGESEVTHLVPNQIAINRAQTAAAHAVMIAGMPIMLVNTDVVTQPITNDPGQVIPVSGETELTNAIHYEAPANFAPQFDNLVNSMMANTLTQSGANDAALGDMKLDNASAFIALREASTVPLQLLQSRFNTFVEDVARNWADFWVSQYGVRRLKMQDAEDVWYVPFNAETLKDVIINAKVDVGPANLYSEIQSIQTLDGLLAAGHITLEQYLERLPKGTIPNQTGLLQELKEQAAAPMPAEEDPMAGAGEIPTQSGGGMADLLAMLPDEDKQKIAGMTPEQQAALAQSLGGSIG